jgi:hypothetical protein
VERPAFEPVWNRGSRAALGSDTFFDWLVRVVAVFASLVGAPSPESRHPVRAPESAWSGPSSKCRLPCWYAATLGCRSADSCAAWCDDPARLARCPGPLDEFFSCVRAQPESVRECNAARPVTAPTACATERARVDACLFEGGVAPSSTPATVPSSSVASPRVPSSSFAPRTALPAKAAPPSRDACRARCQKRNRYTDCAGPEGLMPCPCDCP